MQFVFVVPFCQDDAPFKNFSFLGMTLVVFTSLNIGVAAPACAAANSTEIINFLVIDFVLFAVRAALLLRAGRKAFPSLLRFILAKQLENVPRPMPKAAAAMGDAVAMRLHQAFFVFAEGMTLTASFLYMISFAVVLLAVQEEMVTHASYP